MRTLIRVVCVLGMFGIGMHIEPLGRTTQTYCTLDGVELKMDIYRPQGGSATPPALLCTSDRNSETLRKASPVSWVSSDDPPFLILHGERDPLVPVSQSQIFYEKLRAAGVPATFVIVKNAGHGFVPMGGPITPSRQELTKMIGDFFDQHLK